MSVVDPKTCLLMKSMSLALTGIFLGGCANLQSYSKRTILDSPTSGDGFSQAKGADIPSQRAMEQVVQQTGNSRYEEDKQSANVNEKWSVFHLVAFVRLCEPSLAI